MAAFVCYSHKAIFSERYLFTNPWESDTSQKRIEEITAELTDIEKIEPELTKKVDIDKAMFESA